MTSSQSSDEVVGDFADSLKDLMDNNKYQIQNLTLIAKEYTEHAQAISQALEKHIKSTQPARKLPALYVLDSIIKNVGTPYTVYLGRNLYSTFMEAYSLVDGQTRKAMEAMLKTWKEPVFGSMDSRPVFAPEMVRPIDNALNKLRAITMPRQQPPPQQYGYTATPPQAYGQHQPPQYQQYAQPPAYSELDLLKRDLATLVRNVELELSSDPYSFNSSILQNKLKALHDLSTILHTQQLGPAEFGMIAGQIRSMSAASVPLRPQPTPPVAMPQWQPPGMPQHAVYGNAQHQAPPSIPPVQLNDLAALLNSVPKPSTPQVRAAVPSLQHAPHAQVNAIQAQAVSASSNSGHDLLASLTKAGLMKSTLPPAAPAPPANTGQASLAALLGSLSKGAQASSRKIDLTNKASLETFRPELVQQLYSDQPNQCPQCGRRFADTAEGRKHKDMHLDWHFRINQRMADSGRGHHRNWYLNETDWMKLVEFDESTATADAAAAHNAVVTTNKKKQYVLAPPGVTKTVCSICYEEMRSSYLEDIQEWAFVDAVMNGGKIVHASCLAEMQQGVQGLPVITNTQPTQASLAAALAAIGGNANREASKTPDSSLGKRKAQDDAGGLGKILKES